ncbi:alpha/beta hydrolase [Lysinibacillus xylanilyticus]|uniref:alpha/beta fold hydrolase n=1 Tax=Lysinibacillus xylanilyticus TaxID=582475 RepID=UPI002E215337|nr:alpha/beta hydrolase [Lysinibacillus xylanilyticus]
MEKLGINSVEKVVIGEIEQLVSLRSKNTNNPILLFLHGGPGTAQIAFSRKSQKKLEEFFIVVNWDQRGAGGSFSTSLKMEDLNIERFVLDTEELTTYLLDRFNQKKIFLVGHSWGSIIGLKFSSRRPDLIEAYIGIGQVVDMKRGEKLSYKFTLAEAIRRNNEKAITQLKAIGEPPYKKVNDGGIQRKWLSKFNGSTYNGSLFGIIFKNISMKDIKSLKIIKFIKGSILSLNSLEDEMNTVNFLEEIPEINVPVYFCCGRMDYTVPSELVEEYYVKLSAPHKKIVWFEKSAHLPNFEEVEKFSNLCISLVRNI